LDKKAKNLASLIRLHNWLVDEQRRELGVLVAREDSLIALGQAMARQLLEEQKAATEDPMAGGYLYAAYGRDYRRRREELERLLADLRNEIEQARERLTNAYHQLKVYEEIEKQRAEQERIEEARREQLVFDEISQTQHRLKNR
jgi:flagellar export protein FliJ